MNDDSQSVPFEQRKSQNLTFGDYAKSTLLWVFLPLIGGLSGLAIGAVGKKHFNNKLWPLNGSVTILQHIYEDILSLGFKKTTGAKLKIDEVERLAPFTSFLPDHKRLDATHHIWNFLKGTEIAIIPTAFHFWKRKEQVNVSLTPAYDRLKQLGEINPSDQELAADNAQMRKQIDAMTPNNTHPSRTLNVQSAEHHGRAAEQHLSERERA